VQQLAQNPFLLTLLCFVIERHEIPDDPTRTQIYDRLVRDLLGLRSQAGAPVDEGRASDLLPLMAEIGLNWFEQTRRPPTGTPGPDQDC
jgi:hypothetical protein